MGSIEPENDARLRLDQAMNDRRLSLRMKWHEVAEKAKISVPTLKRVRTGPGSITDWAARGLEEALEWPQGEVARILAADETPAEQGEEEAPRYSDPGLQAIWEAPGLSEAEKQAAITLIEAMRSVSAPQAQGRGWGQRTDRAG
ncbi:hypothetical protein [Streptosporangium saharense]|uniref:hypothetical protein n=1 Tax=Streptosporangium saharense TaxID=1706840 RepID=UPI00343035CF